MDVEPIISIHALSGSHNSRTIRLIGKVHGCIMVVLIDMCRSHNFMDSSIAKKAKLMVLPTNEMAVKVTNGETIKSEGRSCSKVQIQMQDKS